MYDIKMPNEKKSETYYELMKANSDCKERQSYTI